MPSHEEGEFELVLGNKQLLSVFFLVILLLAVFFSMGYIVGRNTAPTPTYSATNRTPPIVVEPAGRVTPPLPDPTKPSALESPKPLRPEPPPAKPEPVKAEPVKPEPVKPEPAKVEPPKKAEPPKKVETAKAEPPKPVKPEPVKPEPAKPAPAKPAPAMAKGGGTYLQVVAGKRPDAERVVATLAQKGFSAVISPVPDSTLVRVLVGPLGDAAAVSKTKDGLQAAGYKPMVRKL